jgi:hypothetical protein
MTKRFNTGISNRRDKESGVSHLVEYLIISGVLLIFLVIMIPMVSVIFIEGPTNQLTSHAFTDIGNGVSTRIIDLYAIIPYYNNATITTKYNIPDEVAGRGYFVEIVGSEEDPINKMIIISGSGIHSNVSLSGIGGTLFGQSGGNTSASGLNYIEYQYPPGG